MGRTIFITASDTDAGKSWLTAGLAAALRQQGMSILALKPVACGNDADGSNGDITALLTAQGLHDPDAINLYRFARAAAPSLAATAEQRQIDPDRLVAWCRERASTAELCLIEGVGGLMVPLTDRFLVSDWLGVLAEAEVWLVAGCRLGSINHTLLTLARLEAMGRSPRHIFLNAPMAADQARLEESRQALLPLVARESRIHTLAHGQRLDRLPEAMK